MNEETTDRSQLLALTTDIVSAYVGNNSIAGSELPNVINDVFSKLVSLGSENAEIEVDLVPAVPIKKSVTKAEITCLDCGKKFKMLKRHLRTDHDLSPQDYRARWGLGHDYPLIAPNYSEVRKKLAVGIGLGRKAGAKIAKRSGPA